VNLSCLSKESFSCLFHVWVDFQKTGPRVERTSTTLNHFYVNAGFANASPPAHSFALGIREKNKVRKKKSLADDLAEQEERSRSSGSRLSVKKSTK